MVKYVLDNKSNLDQLALANILESVMQIRAEIQDDVNRTAITATLLLYLIDQLQEAHDMFVAGQEIQALLLAIICELVALLEGK